MISNCCDLLKVSETFYWGLFIGDFLLGKLLERLFEENPGLFQSPCASTCQLNEVEYFIAG